MTTLLLAATIALIPILAAFALMCRILYRNRGLFMDGPEDE